MSARRQPAEPGMRPRGRFAMGWCPVDGEAFVLDRQAQPWARSRTCSEACAKRLANRSRRPTTCRHCEMVADFHTERRRQELALEDEHRQDEAAVTRLIGFALWLRHYPWPPAEEQARWAA